MPRIPLHPSPVLPRTTRSASLFRAGDLVWISDPDGSMLARVADARGDRLQLRTLVGEPLGWHDASLARAAAGDAQAFEPSGWEQESF
jgi:hypothetical protein